MTKNEKHIAFSGHRPSERLGRSPAELRRCRDALRCVFLSFQIEARSQGAVARLKTMVVAGADVEAAEIATELGMPIEVVLPGPPPAFAKDFEGLSSGYWPRASCLIDDARRGIHGSELINLNDLAGPANRYALVNDRLLQDADAVVVVWNG